MQDKEYNPSTHEYSESMEFSVPKDYKSGVADEYNVDTAAYDAAVIKASKEKRANTRKKTVILQAAAAITTVVVATSSFGYDLLGYDIFNSDSGSGSGSGGYEQPVTDPDPDADVKSRVVLVTYVPTEENYQSPAETFEEAYAKAYDWAKLKGGLDVEMVFKSSSETLSTFVRSSGISEGSTSPRCLLSSTPSLITGSAAITGIPSSFLIRTESSDATVFDTLFKITPLITRSFPYSRYPLIMATTEVLMPLASTIRIAGVPVLTHRS